MRKHEIEIGTEYAHEEHGFVQRVRVVALDQPRDVYSRNSYRPRTVRDGVKVELLDRETGRTRQREVTETIELDTPVYTIGMPPVTSTTLTSFVPQTMVTTTRKITRSWKAQEVAEKAQAESRQKSAAFQTSQKAKVEKAQAILKSHGLVKGDYDVSLARGYGNGYSVDYGKVQLPVSTLMDLLQVAGLEVQES